ncbi:hypothetical protein HDU86_003548 [Geranomyces michiganensis]|nr:hypothetical protein HDU86_003548 [Geranomyces michiganensis]
MANSKGRVQVEKAVRKSARLQAAEAGDDDEPLTPRKSPVVCTPSVTTSGSSAMSSARCKGDQVPVLPAAKTGYLSSDDDGSDAALLVEPHRVVLDHLAGSPAKKTTVADKPATRKRKSPAKASRGRPRKRMAGEKPPAKSNSKCGSDTDSEYPDRSLRIPGEAVLARAHEDEFYYPAYITSYNPSNNKYKVQYSSGHFRSLRRQDFYTKFQPAFNWVQLGDMRQNEDDSGTPMEAFEDSELLADIQSVLPAIRGLVHHDDISQHARCAQFFQKQGDPGGANGIKQLEARVGFGPFDIHEGEYIIRVLMKELFGFDGSRHVNDEELAQQGAQENSRAKRRRNEPAGQEEEPVSSSPAEPDPVFAPGDTSSGRLPSPPLSQWKQNASDRSDSGIALQPSSSLQGNPSHPSPLAPEPEPVSANPLPAAEIELCTPPSQQQHHQQRSLTTTTTTTTTPSFALSSSPRKRKDLFTRLVLLPETIIRILMVRQTPPLDYATAQNEFYAAMREVKMDYVEEIMTARQCAELGDAARR